MDKWVRSRKDGQTRWIIASQIDHLAHFHIRTDIMRRNYDRLSAVFGRVALRLPNEQEPTEVMARICVVVK